ncbi:hypothetical protein NSTC745_06438 [Nostoc sp. DSM 114161]|jgi:hypothetical protein
MTSGAVSSALGYQTLKTEIMTDKQKLTLSEIMARPMPPIDAETQQELDALESLFPEK